MNPKIIGKLKDEESELEKKLQEVRERRTKEKEDSGMTEDDERILEAIEMLIKYHHGEKTRISEILRKLEELEPVVESLSKFVEKNIP